jgi:hypothetical protein
MQKPRALLHALLFVAVLIVRRPATCTKNLDLEPVTACSLVLIGHNSASSSSSSSSSASSDATNAPQTPGVSHASLNCTAPGTSQDAVTVAINTTYLEQHAVNFTGVTIVPSTSCPEQAVNATIHPLLQFCGSHSVHLVQPVVQHVWLQGTIDDELSSVVIAFGGNVTASISAGLFAGNAATHVLLARGNAHLTVSNTVFDSNFGSAAAIGGSTVHVLNSLFSNSHGRKGGGLLVADSAQVSINNSILSNNSAVVAPALFADGQTIVGIFHSMISNHTCVTSGCTAAVQVAANSRLTVLNSTFKHNKTPDNGYGGAMSLAGNSRSSISNSTFESNIGGFGAAIFMQGVSLNVSECEFRQNEGSEGGVAHVKEDAQVMTAASNYEYSVNRRSVECGCVCQGCRSAGAARTVQQLQATQEEQPSRMRNADQVYRSWHLGLPQYGRTKRSL